MSNSGDNESCMRLPAWPGGAVATMQSSRFYVKFGRGGFLVNQLVGRSRSPAEISDKRSIIINELIELPQ